MKSLSRKPVIVQRKITRVPGGLISLKERPVLIEKIPTKSGIRECPVRKYNSRNLPSINQNKYRTNQKSQASSRINYFLIPTPKRVPQNFLSMKTSPVVRKESFKVSKNKPKRVTKRKNIFDCDKKVTEITNKFEVLEISEESDETVDIENSPSRPFVRCTSQSKLLQRLFPNSTYKLSITITQNKLKYDDIILLY